MDLHMGFIDAEHIAEFDNWDTTHHRAGSSEHECAFWVEDREYPRILKDQEPSVIHKKWRFNSKPKDGDRYRLDFDFARAEVSAFYNGERIGLITTSLPKSVYLIASAYWSDTAFE